MTLTPQRLPPRYSAESLLWAALPLATLFADIAFLAHFSPTGTNNYSFGDFMPSAMLLQYILALVAAVLVAYDAPSPRVRGNATYFVVGTLVCSGCCAVPGLIAWCSVALLRSSACQSKPPTVLGIEPRVPETKGKVHRFLMSAPRPQSWPINIVSFLTALSFPVVVFSCIEVMQPYPDNLAMALMFLAMPIALTAFGSAMWVACRAESPRTARAARGFAYGQLIAIAILTTLISMAIVRFGWD